MQRCWLWEGAKINCGKTRAKRPLLYRGGVATVLRQYRDCGGLGGASADEAGARRGQKWVFWKEKVVGMRGVSELVARAERVADIYAVQFDVRRDAAWNLGKLTEELGELQAAYLKAAWQGRCDKAPAAQRQSLEDETADLFGFLMVFASWQGIDLEDVFERKWGAYLPD